MDVRTSCNQGCQVGLFEAKVDKFGLFSNLRLFSVWPFFPKVCLVKSKIWPFLQQSLAFFSYKLLATLVLLLQEFSGCSFTTKTWGGGGKGGGQTGQAFGLGKGILCA